MHWRRLLHWKDDVGIEVEVVWWTFTCSHSLRTCLATAHQHQIIWSTRTTGKFNTGLPGPRKIPKTHQKGIHSSPFFQNMAMCAHLTWLKVLPSSHKNCNVIGSYLCTSHLWCRSDLGNFQHVVLQLLWYYWKTKSVLSSESETTNTWGAWNIY